MLQPRPGLGWKEFFLALKTEWTKDDVGDVAGALTFFAILAVFPFLLFLVALASVVIDPTAAERLVRELGEVAPAQVTEILGGFLRRLGAQRETGLLTLGALGAVWAASSGVASLMRALNTAYGVAETRPFWKVRLIALGTTLFTAVFALAAVLVAVAVPPLAARLGGTAAEVAQWLRLPVAALLMMVVWAVLYFALPNTRLPFRLITPGSVVGVLLWLAASWGFSVYVANFGKYEATYGALGGVVVLLVWMWISSQVVLLGAEINAILARAERTPAGERVASHEPTTAAEPAPTTAVEPAPTPVPAPPAVVERSPRAVWPALAVVTGFGATLALLLRRERRA